MPDTTTNTNGSNSSRTTNEPRQPQTVDQGAYIGKIKQHLLDVRTAIRKRPLFWVAVAALAGNLIGC